MEQGKSNLERAFELASSGRFSRVEDIRLQLKAEGYDETQIHGRTLKAQLRALVRMAIAETDRT